MVVLSRLGEIANPLDGFVARLLEDPQESDSEAGGREHRDLELELNGGLDPNFIVGSAHELDLAPDQKLRVARNLLNPEVKTD